MGDPCESGPCLNGGTCQASVGKGDYWCECPKKPRLYSGLNCEMGSPPCSQLGIQSAIQSARTLVCKLIK